MEGTPSVDTAGHGHGSDVAPERHHPMALGPQPLGIGAGARPTRRVQGHRWSDPVVHQRQQVAAHAAEVGVGDGQHGIGPDGGVDRRATPAQQRRTGRGGQVVGAAHHPRGGVHGGRERVGAHRGTVLVRRCPGDRATAGGGGPRAGDHRPRSAGSPRDRLDRPVGRPGLGDGPAHRHRGRGRRGHRLPGDGHGPGGPGRQHRPGGWGRTAGWRGAAVVGGPAPRPARRSGPGPGPRRCRGHPGRGAAGGVGRGLALPGGPERPGQRHHRGDGGDQRRGQPRPGPRDDPASRPGDRGGPRHR